LVLVDFNSDFRFTPIARKGKVAPMQSDFDASEFIDDDFQQARKSPAGPAPANAVPGGEVKGAEPGRAPTREEVDGKVGELQNKLSELKRAQQELERERGALEELRRRQLEFSTGRQEMVQNLTRGVGLLQEAEFNARRDAEQMAKTLAEMKEALTKVAAIQEESWNKDNLNVELTRALTTVENARMEWNASRLKFPVLDGAIAAAPETEGAPATNPLQEALQQQNYAKLCKLGLYLTWPLALPALGIFIMLILLLSKLR
jgi:hypothetical protein